MLFRTVYGPELEAIYRYVVKQNAQGIYPKRADVYAAFIPRRVDDTFPPTQNVDDALAFLRSAWMVNNAEGGYHAREPMRGVSFAVQVLRALRCIEKGQVSPDHPVDPLYTLFLSELFIKPDRLFVQDVHAAANQLRSVQEVGGVSKEKIQTWKRVMEFLGVGRRIVGGFQCAYSPTFLEDCLGRVLPYARTDGALSQAVSAPLIYLANQGLIEMFPLQDSPTRSYFGEHRYRGIIWRGNGDQDR
jgi:hypothetical protein